MTTPNEHERMVEEARKRYIEMWDRGEFQWNHHKGDSGRKPINPERIWQIFIAPTLTTLTTKVRREVGAELMRLAEGEKRDQDAPKENDPHFTGCGGCGGAYPAICGCKEVNQALDTLKKHITSVTGVK